VYYQSHYLVKYIGILCLRPLRVAKEKNWQGYYCWVPLCKNSTAQRAERERLGLPKISFHSFPNNDTVKKEWIIKIKRDEFKITKDTKICSEHFVPEDFVITLPGYPSERPRLHSHAVPSIFPFSRKIRKRNTLTSTKAAAPLKMCSRPENCLVEMNIDEISCSDREENGEELAVVQDKDEEIKNLKQQIKKLQGELEEARKLTSCSLFRLKNIKDDNSLVKYYTGFPL